MTASSVGPDLVLAGAARSGTSSLAAQLGAHPDIDAGKVKESNYFSRRFDRGPDWYEGLYQERREGLLRLDASTSYTSPQFPEALDKLVGASPDVFVVYAVRQPTQRALSHYLLRRHYFQNEDAPTFGAALRSTPFYVDVSDYSHWLPRLSDVFSQDRLLVVPFEMITKHPHEVVGQVCSQLGLVIPDDTRSAGWRHRNDVVQYRNQAALQFTRRFRRSPLYPWTRNLLGAGRMRKYRSVFTRPATLPNAAEAMSSCDVDQLDSLRALDERAQAAVAKHLVSQDERLGLDWATRLFVPET